MKRIRFLIINWLLILAWMGVIYFFSDQPNLKSDLAPMWDTILRKIAHMAEFFILAYLLFNAYRLSGIGLFQALYMASTIAIVYAFFDEWHQGGVVGRHQSYLDVGIDSLGVFTFAGLRYKYRKNYKK